MSKTEGTVEQKVVAVELEKIQLHPDNGRDKKLLELETLKASIQAAGQLVPGIARTLPDGSIQLVCGRRRYQALFALKAPTMNLIIKPMTDYEAIEAMVTENFQRVDMTIVEELKEIKKLVEAGKAESLTPEAISARLGRTVNWAKRMLALTRLSKKDIERINEFRFIPSIDLLAKFAAVTGDSRHAMIRDAYHSDSEKEMMEKIKRCTRLLSTANFDTSDCIKCRNNSAVEKGLWDDNKEDLGTCMHGGCFEKKAETAAIKALITEAEANPKTTYYAAVSFGFSKNGQNFPANIVFVEGSAERKPHKGMKPAVVIDAYNMMPGEKCFVFAPSENNPGKHNRKASAAAIKEAPIEKQIEVKQETIRGLRLKLVSEYMANEFGKIKKGFYPDSFKAYGDTELLNIGLRFGLKVPGTNYSPDGLKCDSTETNRTMVWISIKDRVLELIACRTGEFAIAKEANLKDICVLTGLSFNELYGKAQVEKPDPKSLVTLLAGKELNDRSAKARKNQNPSSRKKK